MKKRMRHVVNPGVRSEISGLGALDFQGLCFGDVSRMVYDRRAKGID